MLFLGAWYVNLMLAVFALAAVLLILIVLIQRPKGGGLAGAFGGGGGGTEMFGSKTGDWLTAFTVGAFLVFLLMAVFLAWAMAPSPPDEPPATPAVQQVPAETSTPADDLPVIPEPEAESTTAENAAQVPPEVTESVAEETSDDDDPDALP